MALLSGILNVYRRKVDRLEDLKGSYVSRTDLEKHLDGIAAARALMHQENTRKLERIEDGLRRVHDRIDQIPFRTANARTRASDQR